MRHHKNAGSPWACDSQKFACCASSESFNKPSKLSSVYFSSSPSFLSFIPPCLSSLHFLTSFPPLPHPSNSFCLFLLSLFLSFFYWDKFLFCRPRCPRTHSVGSHSVAKLSSSSQMTLLCLGLQEWTTTPSFKFNQQWNLSQLE